MIEFRKYIRNLPEKSEHHEDALEYVSYLERIGMFDTTEAIDDVYSLYTKLAQDGGYGAWQIESQCLRLAEDIQNR